MNYFMKKSFSLLVFLSSVVFFSGCTKTTENVEFTVQKNIQTESGTPRTENSSLLASDINFGNLTNATYEYLDFMNQLIKRNNLNFEEINSGLSELSNQNLPYENQIQRINALFCENISYELSTYMTIFSENWLALKEKFPDISEEELNSAVSESLENNSMLQQRVSEYPSDCGWRYYLCATAATSAAILCHAGCSGTAIVTTAGLGVPACVALCGSIQVYAISECFDKYCD